MKNSCTFIYLKENLNKESLKIFYWKEKVMKKYSKNVCKEKILNMK